MHQARGRIDCRFRRHWCSGCSGKSGTVSFLIRVKLETQQSFSGRKRNVIIQSDTRWYWLFHHNTCTCTNAIPAPLFLHIICTMILKPHYAPINAAPLPTTWIRDTFSWKYDCISPKNWKLRPCVERALLGLHIVDGAQTMTSSKKAYNMKNRTMNFSWYIVYDLVEQLKSLWIKLPSLNISYTW